MTSDNEAREEKREENAEEVKTDAAKKRGRGVLTLFSLIVIAAVVYFAPQITSLIDARRMDEEEGAEVSAVFGKHMTAEVLKEKILQQAKLLTHTHEFDVRVYFQDNMNIPWTDFRLPGGKREFSVSVPVTVDMTTDLELMEIEYDERANAAKIFIPNSEPFRITPDISQLSSEEDIGLFRSKMTPEEQRWLVVEAEDTARNKVDESGVVVIANERASKLLTDMAKRLGVEYVEVATR